MCLFLPYREKNRSGAFCIRSCVRVSCAGARGHSERGHFSQHVLLVCFLSLFVRQVRGHKVKAKLFYLVRYLKKTMLIFFPGYKVIRLMLTMVHVCNSLITSSLSVVFVCLGYHTLMVDYFF